MTQSLLEMAKDLVQELIKNDLLTPEDMQQELMKTHASLLELKAQEDRDRSTLLGGEGETVGIVQAVDWRKSIRKHTVECLVCGQTFKQLSARHLNQHGLNPRTYRQQFGIPRNQPLSAKETTAARRRVVQDIRPWEKAPTYEKAHPPTPEPTPTSARPKRVRKKTAATKASA
jgi:predicted transcriptional regulator